MLRHLFLLFTVFSVALGAVYIQQLEEKPAEYANCDGCWLSELNTFLDIGEQIPSPTECKQYQCNAENVQVFTCGAVGVKPPCYVTRDESLLYPNCCDTIVCPENTSN